MNPTNLIDIQPVQVWTSTGLKTAVQLDVRSVFYYGDSAQANVILRSEDGYELKVETVGVAKELTDAWTDDAVFYAAIATSVGLTPVS